MIGGGPISLRDAVNLIDATCPVIAIAGTGRLADQLATQGTVTDPTLARLHDSPLLHLLATAEPEPLVTALRAHLSGDHQLNQSLRGAAPLIELLDALDQPRTSRPPFIEAGDER